MSKPLEADIENKFSRYALTFGCVTLKMEVKGSRNWPDRQILMGNGYVFFIEFKRPGEKPRKGQLYRHKVLRKHGYNVYVCDSVMDAIAVLEQELLIHG